MYLLVNIVTMNWRDYSINNKISSLSCLRLMLKFLEPTESSKFLTLIINTIYSLMCNKFDGTMESSKVRLLEVKISSHFVKILLDYQVKTVCANFISIVFTMFPNLDSYQVIETTNNDGEYIK